MDAAYLIPFKAKAWMVLSDRKSAGEHVDNTNIKKHKTYKSRGTPLSITYPLNTPIVTNITYLMGADALNFEVEPGGSITMHNATELPVPATIQYVEKLSEVVSND